MRRPRNFQTGMCDHLISRAEIEPSFPAHVPRLLSHGDNKVARDLLAVLADGPKRPAELRRELGVASPNYFTSC